MTKRLYYNDSFLLNFDARIVETGMSGNRHYTVLNQSAFYPTSGGQMHDIGYLNKVRVHEVIETEAGEVWHLSQEPVGSVDETVVGEVDLERRQINRQLHTAQHILSQTFVKLNGFETVSVHLGLEYGAVELDTKEIAPEQLKEAQRYANEIIARNWPVEVLFIESDKLDSIPLRKIPDRQGTIRVVRIDDFDYSACGGTHCRTTAEVRLLVLNGTEKIRGRVLVKFLCGEQALEDYHKRYEITSRLTQSLTCNMNDLSGKFEKLLEENKSLRKEIAEQQKELLPILAARLAEKAVAVGAHRLVFETLSNPDPRAAGQLVGMTAEHLGSVVALIAGDRMILATPPEGPYDAGRIAQEMISRFGLKGGGSKKQAQLANLNMSLLPEYKESLIKIIANE